MDLHDFTKIFLARKPLLLLKYPPDENITGKSKANLQAKDIPEVSRKAVKARMVE